MKRLNIDLLKDIDGKRLSYFEKIAAMAVEFSLCMLMMSACNIWLNVVPSDDKSAVVMCLGGGESVILIVGLLVECMRKWTFYMDDEFLHTC